MPGIEWTELRQKLVASFDEDTVQQVLLELLEAQARGVHVLDPLRWCRLRAASRRKNARRDEWIEQQAKRELTALGITLDTRSEADMKRRHRRIDREYQQRVRDRRKAEAA